MSACRGLDWSSEHVMTVYRAADGLHMQDIESGLYHSLWLEIPSREAFDQQDFSAIKAYIEVLSKVLYNTLH